MLGGKEALLKAFVDSGLISASQAVWMAKEGGKEKMLSGNPGRNKYGWGCGQQAKRPTDDPRSERQDELRGTGAD